MLISFVVVLINLIPRVLYLPGSVQLFFEIWTVQYFLFLLDMVVAKLPFVNGAHTDDKHPLSASHHKIGTPIKIPQEVQ